MQLQEYAGARIGGYAARRYTVIRHVALWFAVVSQAFSSGLLFSHPTPLDTRYQF